MEFKVKAKEVMTSPVVCIESEKSVFETAKLMKQKRIGTVVITINKRPVGITTEKDIITRVVAEGKDAKKVDVGQIMTAPIMVADAGSDVNEIAKKMAEKRVRRVPIVEKGKIVGMITERDILKSEPGLVDTMKEMLHVEEDKGALLDEGPLTGVCDECDEYSEALESKGGRYLCPQCRGE